MVDQIRFFAGAARVLEGKSSGEYMRGFTSSIRREPVGPVGQVSPWNYPMMMSVWKFAPALAAGNTVVLKPSDTTPASSAWMVEKMQDIFPPGVCNLVCGDRDTGAELTKHPIPQLVSITGSTRAGIAVATAAAADLKRAHLELGGKAPVVVFDDADIAAAVEGISVAGLFNGGQDCTAATRVIVQQGVYDEFVSALTETAKNTKTGYDPDDEDILYGPINNANQLGHVSGLVERAPEHARVTTGGHRIGDRGYFYEPTIVADLQQDDELIQTEVFGPVQTVQKFTDEDAGSPVLQRQPLRPGLLGLDQQHQHGVADGGPPRLRLRVGQHAHPARRRDAARRVQALRLRQGPVDVRPRGLHPHQARDDLSRVRRMTPSRRRT